MRIGCLQFGPQVGEVDSNIGRADAILERNNPKNLDLLVLPEMAFSDSTLRRTWFWQMKELTVQGYNFKSLDQIKPYLEPTTSGATTLWAIHAARKFKCYVVVGYPEIAASTVVGEMPKHFNSAVTVSPDGKVIANYRKSFLYYTDDTWASEGSGFFSGEILNLGKVVMGICMDLNPYKFEAPWTDYEFGSHIVQEEADLTILSTAWNTREDFTTFHKLPEEPCMSTLSYWIGRLQPLIGAKDDRQFVIAFANRSGIEDDAVYAGTSAVISIQDGEVKLYGILGRNEEKLLIADTSIPRGRLAFNMEDAE